MIFFKNSKNGKLRKKHLDYDSENLAFPEVHIDTEGEDHYAAHSEDDSADDGQVVFDNLAVPEIKIKRKIKK